MIDMGAVVGPRWVGGVTAWAGFGLLGLLLVFPVSIEDDDRGRTATTSSTDPRPWASPIFWTGELATQVCAPNGVASCAGVRHGDHDDLHIVTLDRTPSSVDITLEWDATSTGIHDLAVALDGVVVRKDCDGCASYRFRVIEKAQGPSPLNVVAQDLELAPGEEIAILVRVPDGFQSPVMAQAWTSQPFSVTGTMRGD